MAQYEDVFQHRFTATGAEQVAGGFGMIGGAAGTSQTRLQQWQATIGFLGPHLQRAGDAMARFTAENVAAHQDMEDVDRQLAAMYARRGYGDEAVAATKRLASELQYLGGVNDEETKRAATLMASFQMMPEEISAMLPHMASQAWLTRDSLESVAMAVGKAFGSGQFGQLTRYGMTLDAVARAELSRAQKMQASEDPAERARGRAVAFDLVLQSLAENTADISERMDTARGQIDRLQHTWGDVQEQMGAGVSDLQKWGSEFLFNIVQPLSEGNEEMWRWIGMTTYMGGALTKAGGSIGGFVRDYLQFRATMNLARVAKENMSRATMGDIATENRKIGVAGREAAALKRVATQATATGKAVGGIGGWMTGGLGFSRMMGMEHMPGGGRVGAGALLRGAHGAGAALSSVTLVAGTAVLGWEVGKAISGWLDEHTDYIERGGTWLAEQSRLGRRAAREGDWADRMVSEFAGTGKRGADIYKRMIAGEISEREALALLAQLRGETADVTARRPRWWQRREATASASDVTPTGDVLLRVPGDHVLTHQAARDWAHLR